MICVLLVDDHLRFRTALRARLEQSGTMAVVGEAGNAREAFDAICTVERQRGALPDVVVMDVCLGGEDGIELTRRLLVRWPSLNVIALSTHDDPALVRAWIESGGCGYILKGDPLPELLCAISEAAAGRGRRSGAPSEARRSTDGQASKLGNPASDSPHPPDSEPPGGSIR